MAETDNWSVDIGVGVSGEWGGVVEEEEEERILLLADEVACAGLVDGVELASSVYQVVLVGYYDEVLHGGLADEVVLDEVVPVGLTD